MPSFLSLPGEVRNQIYEMAIYPKTDVAKIWGVSKRHIEQDFLWQGIFRVCTQVREEALSYLFANKTIYCSTTLSALALFKYLNPSAKRYIKHLIIDKWTPTISHSRQFYAEHLPRMKNLARLELVKPEWFKSKDMENFWEVMDQIKAHGVKVVFIVHRGKWYKIDFGVERALGGFSRRSRWGPNGP